MGRLAAYEARTQAPLDLLALATLWLAVVPPGDFGTTHGFRDIVLVARFGLSVVYGIDMTIRSALARRHVHYALTHPVGIVSVLWPPARVIFSFRLVRSVFKRGNLSRFLLAASMLVLDCAVIVYLFERHAPKSNIHTLGESLWWSAVTVTTVGYGDFYPVTTPGRITACFVMGIGLLTLAVVTAQVASSFVAQGPGKARPGPARVGRTRSDTGRTRPAACPSRGTPYRRHNVGIASRGTSTGTGIRRRLVLTLAARADAHVAGPLRRAHVRRADVFTEVRRLYAGHSL